MVTWSALVSTLAVLGHAQATRFLGRVSPTTKELTWPATGVAFTFTGTQAVVTFSQVIGSNSLALIVDGGAPTIIDSITTNNITTPKLKQGTHSIVLRKRSETNFGTLVFQTVTTDGAIGKDTIPTRRIEYIGDSITVGYGEDGTYPCTNTAALEDGPKTYGALTASNLSSDYSLVAWSGKGLVRNYAQSTPDTSPIMPQLWTRYGGNDADNSYTFPAASTPQAVVINLGTNDFSYLGVRDSLNATTYQQAYVSFIKTVQSHYPQANMFLTSSPMLSDSYPTAQDAQHTTQANAIKGAIAQVGNSRLHFVDFPSQSGADGTIGCDYHPALSEHEVMAGILIPAIKSALKW